MQHDDRDAFPPGGALVIGGEYRGLGVVRSLGRRGIPVWVLTDDHLVAGTSRYARHRLPWPTRDPATQIRFLLDLARQHCLEGWALIPTGDETAAFIAHHHAALRERFRLTTPDWEMIRWAYDKRLTHQLADATGVDQPWTYHPRGREDVVALDGSFPVILKPAIKTGFNTFTHAKAWRVDDRAALLAGYDAACALVPPDVVMIQELIPGGGEAQFSYAALCRNGQPLASIIARRTRQYPVDFGRASSFVETIDCPSVEEPARRLLAAIGFTGLIEVEFKRDCRDGRYKLLDLNPRVWGWHTLGKRAGVDFTYLLWQMIHGQPISEVRARAGVRWMRLVTDLLAVASDIRRGSLSLGAYLRSLRGTLEPSMLALDDPLPAILDIPLLGYLAWKRRTAGPTA